MNRLKLSIFSCMLATVLTAMLLTAEVAEAAPLSSGKWSIVPSPSPGSAAGLSGVVAISAKDVWAVGSYVNSQKNAQQTLIEHWNGSKWNVVRSPNLGTSNNALTSVAAVSASDIWAVGNTTNNSGFTRTLTEHWNGTSWKALPSPNLGSTYNYLLGLAIVSAKDIWTVGIYFKGAQQQTLTEHWNGTNWQVVTSPNPGTYDYLYGVVAVSANNVWAVGNYSNSGGNDQALIEHWNGSSWQVVKSPKLGSGGNALNAVAVVSAKDIWAVGGFVNGGGLGETLVEHWNGSSWQVVKSPNAGSSSNGLSGITVVSANNVWAVGDYSNTNSNTKTLTEQWNGTRWQVVTSPNLGKGISTILSSVVPVPGNGSLWSVGYGSFGEGSEQTLTAFYS